MRTVAVMKHLRLALTILVVTGAMLVRCNLWAQEAPLPKVEPRHITIDLALSHRPESSRSWWLMYGVLTLATVADVESTFHGLDRCATCREGNPIMRPFVERGRGATYAFTFGLNALTMELARRARNRHERHWYVGPMISTGVHAGGAAWNVSGGTD